MRKIYYKKYQQNNKTSTQNQRKIRYSGIVLLLLGVGILLYNSFPVLIWQVFFKSALASVKAPIPPPFILTPESIYAMETENTEKLNPQTNKLLEKSDWIQEYHLKQNQNLTLLTYTISIPELKISHALVSTADFNLDEHLVQYWGTPIPPLQGNTVIFGHSSLPQLFNQNNYRTIFANAHNIKTGDKIFVHFDNEIYTYNVIKTYVTTPDDLSVLKQDSKGSYITIITCTPPGTTWKRFVIKAMLITDNS